MISVESLCVKYGNHEVLSDISFSVREGDFLGVVGPNGSGKTTLVKTLAGLLTPSSGQVLFGDEKGARLHSVGYLPQTAGVTSPLFPATAEEVVASGLAVGRRFPRWSGKGDAVKVDKALRLLSIDNLSKRKVGELSGGQQQRVHLARALVSAPELLLLDEPTGALDPNSRDCFYETLSHLNERHGITIIIVSHDSHAIGNYIRTILYLDRKVLFYGGIKEFQETSPSEHYFGGGPAHQCQEIYND